MTTYHSANDLSSFTYKIFYAGEMITWLTSVDPKSAMKRAIKLVANRKDSRKGCYVLFRPYAAKRGDEAAALEYSRNGAKVEDTKRFEDCTRDELRNAAKHCGLDEESSAFMDYIYGDANQTAAFDKKVIAQLKKWGYSKVKYTTTSFMTVV